MNFVDVMQSLADQLDTIDGLRCFPYPPDNISPPASFPEWPDEVTYDETYGRGLDSMTIPVVVLVSKVSDRAAMTQLGEYLSGSGDRSIKQVLEAGNGSWTAMATVEVTRAELGQRTVAGVAYIGALFDVEITGSGS